MIPSRRICTVEKSFTALMVEWRAKRVFKLGETLFWDGNGTDAVTFEVDNVGGLNGSTQH
jgi:hypothetical protein